MSWFLQRYLRHIRRCIKLQHVASLKHLSKLLDCYNNCSLTAFVAYELIMSSYELKWAHESTPSRLRVDSESTPSRLMAPWRHGMSSNELKWAHLSSYELKWAHESTHESTRSRLMAPWPHGMSSIELIWGHLSSYEYSWVLIWAHLSSNELKWAQMSSWVDSESTPSRLRVDSVATML